MVVVNPDGSNVGASVTVTADTEFPAAAALADATANPTTTVVGSMNEHFNGTTWDRSRGGQTANSATVTGFQNNLPMARYDSSVTARTTGQFGNLQSDINGAMQVNNYTLAAGENQTLDVQAVQIKPSASATYSATSTSNLGAATAANLKGTTGNVFSCYATNTNAAVRYFQIHNKATIPLAGEAPVYSFLIPASGGMIVIGNDFFGAPGVNLSLGIGYAISTAAGTYTAATAGDHMSAVTFI